jgi:raffinose/stachyose/melibiose transport system permease protein
VEREVVARRPLRRGFRATSGHRRDAAGWLYVALPLIMFSFVVLAPLAYTVRISLLHWDGVSPPSSAGLANYHQVFTDQLVRIGFLHSLFLVAFYSVAPIGLGLALTAVLTQRRTRLLALWRVVLFLPQALSIVVMGVAWQWLLQGDGPVNQLLRLVGLGSITRPWLGDFTFALPSEGLIGTWANSGLCMVLLIAGAQSIDQSLYDAARVDGAGFIREFFAVTLPGLRNVTVVCAVLTLAISLNNFGLVWVTTQGGPGTATQVLSTVLYTKAFVLDNFGGAAALAIVLTLLMISISYVISRRSEGV